MVYEYVGEVENVIWGLGRLKIRILSYGGGGLKLLKKIVIMIGYLNSSLEGN